MVLVDAGDALARSVRLDVEPVPTQAERRKMSFILETMGKLGYDAMAVGERDLVLGVEELKKMAAKAKVTLLAANLLDKGGKRPFEQRKLVTAGGVKVGIFAVAEGAELERKGLKVLPALEQANLQARALRKAGADLVVALLHQDYDSALKTAQKLQGVDFAIQSHGGRVSSTQAVGKVVLAAGGERGRRLGRAEFELGGKGPLFDRAEAKSARAQLGHLEQTIGKYKQQQQQASAQAEKDQLERLLKPLAKRRQELLAKMEAEAPAGRNSVLCELVPLDRRVADDPEIAQAAKEVESAAR